MNAEEQSVSVNKESTVVASEGLMLKHPYTVIKSAKFEGCYFFHNIETKQSDWYLDKKYCLSILPNHIGYPRAIRLTGVGMLFTRLEGIYYLDLSVSEERIYRRDAACVCFDSMSCSWVLKLSNGQIAARQGHMNRDSPDGDWLENKRVFSIKDSGSTVNILAFPAPRLDLKFYAKKGISELPLLKQPNLIMLNPIVGSHVERIPAVFHQYPNAKYTILYSHGNGEDLGLIVDSMAGMAKKLKSNVFVYDYIGYSTSKLEGSAPSEAGCIRSIEAAWKCLTVDLKVSPETIVLYGRSIGSGPTIELASRDELRHTIAGVLLQSPILSGGSVLLGPNTASSIARPFDIFTNYTKIGQIERPVGIIHGTEDQVVPVSHGERLHALCRDPFEPEWLKGYGHNDVPPRMSDNYAKKFLAWLRRTKVIATEEAKEATNDSNDFSDVPNDEGLNTEANVLDGRALDEDSDGDSANGDAFNIFT